MEKLNKLKKKKEKYNEKIEVIQTQEKQKIEKKIKLRHANVRILNLKTKLQKMKDEITRGMTLMGTRNVNELTKDKIAFR